MSKGGSTFVMLLVAIIFKKAGLTYIKTYVVHFAVGLTLATRRPLIYSVKRLLDLLMVFLGLMLL